MISQKTYDLAIVGGGLAGLSLAILQAKAGKNVILFEKEKYPFHRVCGEYVSLESRDFLYSLGLPIDEMKLPIITKLQVSSPKGTLLETPLDLGGFGISRYFLDFELAKIAKKNGVTIFENTKVLDVISTENLSEIITQTDNYFAHKAVGSFGKRANLDVAWHRDFIQKNRTTLNQYIGVKYHIKIDFPKDKIALHNFKDGYCGISAIENDTYCLCYLTTKNNLKKCQNSIPEMEKTILAKNPHIAEIFNNSERLWDKPLVISQISFEKKTLFERQIPLIGDATGSITPLCGNGMSMAFHNAYLLHQILLEGSDIYSIYPQKWNAIFAKRLRVGRFIQLLFGNEITTDILVKTMKRTPRILQYLIKNTHGSNIVHSKTKN